MIFSLHYYVIPLSFTKSCACSMLALWSVLIQEAPSNHKVPSLTTASLHYNGVLLPPPADTSGSL